jgi:hypothetical protein
VRGEPQIEIADLAMAGRAVRARRDLLARSTAAGRGCDPIEIADLARDATEHTACSFEIADLAG